MTELSREEVLKIASLGKLQLSEQEVSFYQKELASVLSYFEDIDSLKSNLPPDFRGDILGEATPERADTPTPSLSIDLLLREAPRKQGTSFVVPKIFD